MTTKGSRPGGRSARIQQAVHQAVRDLQDELGRAELTVPMIADRAGVTPSTIYRRWGDLTELLSDVAVERLRPQAPPADRGNLHDDLMTWASEFLEEVSSPTGRAFIVDALGGDPERGNAGQCSAFTAEAVGIILGRAAARGERTPSIEMVLDHVVAPITYRVLFRSDRLWDDSRTFVRTLLSNLAAITVTNPTPGN
ncbi:TetR/AcrR family transcriptional regulator [Amycolatopsis rhizosphaerae]|uniref:TetR/AcrR family transcriptional regulator n=1 Tax=Amycolatopsis rhizosphaerae TaxID=2053003 RepID=A0A558CZ87_9PSEU|nr:TetR/AcrR family transcriptional regulator [Amycolatopsis rhizosphaerae]TVT54092.1 TetR/AcrR family transcriptional regulator [Amycolatopsis rhizosphaerae]